MHRCRTTGASMERRGGQEADGPEEDLLLWLSGLPGPTSATGEPAARGEGEFRIHCLLRAGETGGMEENTLTMPSRSQKFDPELFCRTYGLKRGEFARMTWISPEGAEKPTAARVGRRNGHQAEVIRLLRALGSLIVPEKFGPWIRKPNRGLEGLTPIEVIERAKPAGSGG